MRSRSTDDRVQHELRHSFGHIEYLHRHARVIRPARSRKSRPRCSSSTGTPTFRPAPATCATSTARFNVNIDGTYYANFDGQHTFKAGVQWERLSNDVLTGAQAPNSRAQLERARARRSTMPPRQSSAAPTATTRCPRSYTEGKIHSNNIGFFIQDAWTVNNRLTLNLGLRADREDIPSYRAENPGIEFGFGEDRAARRLRLRHQGRRPVEGLRQLGHVLRHQQARDAARQLGAPIAGSTTTTRSTPSTGRRINCEGPPGNGCPGTFIEQVDFRHVSNDPNNPLIDPEPEADPDAGVHARSRSRADVDRCRSACATRTSGWIGRSKTSASRCRASARCSMIANPGYGIAEITLAASSARPAQPAEAKRDYDGVEFRLRSGSSNAGP